MITLETLRKARIRQQQAGWEEKFKEKFRKWASQYDHIILARVRAYMNSPFHAKSFDATPPTENVAIYVNPPLTYNEVVGDLI